MFKNVPTIFSLICLLSSIDLIRSSFDSDQYRDLSVLRIHPKNHFQMISLLWLEEEADVDFWKRPSKIHQSADLMITPDNKEMVLQFLNARNIDYEVHIGNVQKLIENERHQAFNADRALNMTRNLMSDKLRVEDGFWLKYQRYDKIQAFLKELVDSSPELVKMGSIGKSFEKRNLAYVSISTDYNKNKPVVYIQGGIHAREWISPAMVTYFLNELIKGYQNKDNNMVKLLEVFDFYVVPVLNADGYEYTHTNNRLWRKTRSTTVSTSCPGVDPNRNYDYKWGGTGTSSNPCSEIYRGVKAFSEPETKAESEFILNKLAKRVKVLLAIHSYGQYWLYPWGYASELTPDDKILNQMSKVATDAIKARHDKKYIYGTSTNVLYAAAGATDDWAYGAANVTFSYTVELRDTGSYGFQLPANQIVPTSEEVLDGIVAMLLKIQETIKW